MRRRLWNLRFRLARAILPGVHHHISVYQTHDECPRTVCVASRRLARNAADGMDEMVRGVLS